MIGLVKRLLRSRKVNDHVKSHDPTHAVLQDFATLLVSCSLVDKAGMSRAQRASNQSGERLDHVLAKLGLLAEVALGETLARHLGLGFATLNDLPPNAVLPDQIEAAFVRNRQVIPLACNEQELTVAVVDPFDLEPVRALSYLLDRPAICRLIVASDFTAAVASLYGHKDDVVAVDTNWSDTAVEADIERLRDIANDAPVIRIVNDLIFAAVDSRASDIHLEPSLSGLVVRYRVNGDLQIVRTIDSGLRAAVTSRIKIMARLDIAERRLPQDGRTKIAVGGVDIEFRVSTLPNIHGEGVVLRVLDRSAVELDLVKLGFDQSRIDTLHALMREPNGIVLVTGPTGSGKTTTLYSMLNDLNQPSVKIFTVEDPIEYEISGINQVQVHSSIGLDFPQVLRSILRQNPNIVMIGEIRDLETARIAIQTSLTGHLVFSTLHTNSAAASITRLVDMGVENYLIASTVNAVLAQRLVRRLCVDCATPHPNAEQWINRIALELGRARDTVKVLKPHGCAACRGTGFSGRIAIAELMIMDDERRGLVLSGAADRDLENAAKRSGMRTLFEDGLEKIADGLATVEDVLRATRVDA